MKIRNQSGIAHLGLILLVLVLAVAGAVGWYVWDKNKDNSRNSSSNLPTEKYEFKEFGLSMDILPGWLVSKQTAETKDYSNKGEPKLTTTTWEIENNNYDGKIVYRAGWFRGGWQGCGLERDNDLTPATIKDVAPTQDSSLVFLDLTYTPLYSENPESVRQVTIALANEKIYSATNSNKAPRITNSELKPGKYYFCATEPGPGWDLGLVKGVDIDSISVYANNPDNEGITKYLAEDAKSYPDIKKMLTSINKL